MQRGERAIYSLSLHQSEDPSRFELFCFVSKCLQWMAQNIYSIYLNTELYQRKIFDYIIHTMSI